MDQLEDVVRAGQTGVGHAVGAQDHPVDRAVTVGGACHLIAQGQPGGGVRGSIGSQAADRVQDRPPLTHRRRRKHHPRVHTEGDDADLIGWTEHLNQTLQRGLNGVEPRSHLHRAGGIHHKGEHRVFALLIANLHPGDADAQHPVAIVLRKGRRPAVHAQGESTFLGRGLTVIEVVNKFLHAHGLRRRQVGFGEVAAGDRVRAGIDVEGEG